MKRIKIKSVIRNIIFVKSGSVLTTKSHNINEDQSIEEYYKSVERPYIAIK